ncbi:hypothetical protein CN689_26385 [Peribacillus butanolivorans]|uniref:HipA-like kinase domain-containing protein n=1 Tax=Peribacillus butanolivorans TaxID=421767 RepID=A0AAX0RYJ6_9BACI|nr:HipA family kinase [Peribacillus butanolivorans]PEJ25042.1 hypothetical protein CN689_26385 [Peribacillus butanolivorans]
MTKRATNYMGEIGKGRTNPKLIECSDGNIYVVKFMNAEFKRSIINDWIAYQLGKLINLPMPDCEIISIPDGLIQSSEIFKKTGVSAGLAFGSIFKKNKISVNNNSLAKCRNINNLADMFIFDMWINNRDRNKNNMIIVNDHQPTLLFIDHEKAFCGRNWKEHDLIKFSEILNPRWSKNQIYFIQHLKNNDLFQNPLQLIQSLTIAQIREAVYSIPKEWNLKESEQEHLIDFLVKRRELLGEQIQQIIKKHF